MSQSKRASVCTKSGMTKLGDRQPPMADMVNVNNVESPLIWVWVLPKVATSTLCD